MSESDLERLRRKHARRVQESLNEDSGFTDDNLLSDFERFSFEALTSLDPNASRLGGLSVHLDGLLVENGNPDVRATDTVVGALQEEVHLAGGGVRELTRLQYAGFTPGSTVVHLLPAESITSNDNRLAGPTSPIDSAIRRVFDAHDILENNLPASQLAADYSDMLEGLRKLIRALQRYDLQMDLSWQSPVGRSSRRSRLSTIGKRYGIDLLQSETVRESVEFTGRIFGLSLDGQITVRVSPRRGKATNHRVRVDPEVISDLGLRLQEVVSIKVDQEYQQDRLGKRTNIVNNFREVVARGIDLSTAPHDA